MRTPGALLAAASVFYLTAASVGFSFLSTTPAVAQAAQAPAAAGPAATYVGSQACRRCHAAIYERWSKTRMANVVADPKRPSRRDHSRPLQAGSARHVHAGRHRVRLRHASGSSATSPRSATTISRSAHSGTSLNKVWRPYLVQPNTDWWVPFYPRRQHAAARPARSATAAIPSTTTSRRRSVTEWNVGCERCHGPAAPTSRGRPRRPSSIPRAWTTCAPTTPASSATRRASRSTNPIQGKYYDWPVGFHQGGNLQGLLEARRAQARRDDVHAFRRRHRAQEPHAGQRLRAERDVHARRHLLQLPRRARHRQQCRPDQARARSVPDCHGPTSPNGPHAPTLEAHTHHTRGSAGQRMHRLPHAEDRARQSPT